MNLNELLISIKCEYPEFRLVDKSASGLMRVIDFLLKLITLWRMKNFMTSFTTTLGFVVYTPSSWGDLSERAKVAVLRHERVHMHQKENEGFWFSVKYLLLPIPILWAYYRMKYEMEAYEMSMKVLWEYQGSAAFTEEYKTRMLQHFTSAEYFWMWPWKKRLNKWYDGVLAQMVG